MNHTSDLRPFSAPSAHPLSGVAWKGLFLAVPALLALGGTGCYRASGLQRTTVVAEAIPEFGGDRVLGLKSAAGPGDYFLGNDFVQIAIDGTRFGDTSQGPIAGAASGGSIVDAGTVSLDTSYQRVNVPTDALERLTPVVNQDPDLEIVFDSFKPDSTREPALLTMTGRVLDAGHKIPGATWDADGRVKGVTVVHVLSLAKLDRFFTLSTTLVNESGATLGIRSLGDYLYQSTGGYKFAIPAGLDITGEQLPRNWGIQIPGSDFGNPIATSVQTSMVGMVAVEPGSASLDAHASLGLMSTDTPTSMVTSDPQDALRPDRPIFPHRLVVGSLPLPPAGLAAGASLTHNRRLYILGGTSNNGSAPNQPGPLFNGMAVARYNTTNGIWPQDFGQLYYGVSGSAMKMGPLPTEIRVERLVRGVPDGPAFQQLWIPERVEWLETGENISSTSAFPSGTVTEFLPSGTYRMVLTNQLGTQVKLKSINASSGLRPLLREFIELYPSQLFTIGSTDYLCPEADQVVSASGTMVRSLFASHYFDTRERNSPTGSLQPLRIVIKGTGGTPDPWIRRSRTLGTFFDPITKAVAVASSPGQNQIRAGNEMFGTGFFNYVQTRYFWLPNGTPTGQVTDGGYPVVTGGTFRAYGTRGPLSALESEDIVSYDGQTDNVHSFIVWPRALPSGWTTFDLPGASLATTGGLLPGEKLTSALAEGVQVVAHTEQDLGTDANALYNDYKFEFNASGFLATHLTAIGNDPYVVGARSSLLPGFGAVTALFTPAATRYRFGGAIQPDHWTLADFITQAKGKYTVVHRPRGPQGLFTEQAFDSSALAASGFPAWWSGSGAYASGTTNGGFDALELLRAEGFDAANPDPWFQEFLQVRSDWFAILNRQTPTQFTKALGLSAAKYTLDTPVGLARTYLKAAPVLTNPPVATVTPTAPLVQDLSTVLAALKSGAAVASTGPFLDVSVGTTGPGGLVAGPLATASLNVNLYRTDWMPLDELRIVVNGAVAVDHIDPATFTVSATDAGLSRRTFQVPMPATGTGAWIVVEAGVRLDQAGPYAVGTPWHDIMRGIYPIAVTNPIFIDVTGHGYTHP